MNRNSVYQMYEMPQGSLQHCMLTVKLNFKKNERTRSEQAPKLRSLKAVSYRDLRVFGQMSGFKPGEGDRSKSTDLILSLEGKDTV